MQAPPTLVVVAAPDALASRVGAKFKLAPGAPLLIGGSPKARVAVGGSHTGDLSITVDGSGGLTVARTRQAPGAWLGGRPLGEAAVRWEEDGTLSVEGGWGFERLRAVVDFPVELERTLASRPDDEPTWDVYRDALLERGSWVGPWLVRPAHDDAARLAALGTLAWAATAGLLQVSWDRHGLVTSVRLSRSALVEPPGHAWFLRALAREPLLRTVRSLAVEAFVGQAASASGADVEAAGWIDAVAALPCAPFLRALRLGSVDAPALPLAADAEARLRERAPHLSQPPGRVVCAGLVPWLQLLRVPPELSVVGLAVGERRRLSVGRTVIGGDGHGAQVRVLGLVAPRALAAFAGAGGQWSVAVEGEAPRLLLPEDEVDVAGIRLRVTFAAEN